MVKFITVYDTRTGRKLSHKVPDTWMRVFPHLSQTPAAKRRSKKKETATSADEPGSAAVDTAPEEETEDGRSSSR